MIAMLQGIVVENGKGVKGNFQVAPELTTPCPPKLASLHPLDGCQYVDVFTQVHEHLKQCKGKQTPKEVTPRTTVKLQIRES